MAHTLSAKKRIRQDRKRHARNRWRKDQIKDVVKVFHQAVHDGDEQQMARALQACYRKLDEGAAKGTIHKNTASRRKSRLAAAMHKTLNKAHS